MIFELPSSAVALIAAALLSLWTWVGANLRGADMRPALMHNVAWTGALLIIGAELIRFDEVGAYAWSIILTSIGAFNLGVFAAGRRQRATASRRAREFRPTREWFVSARTFWVLLLLYTVGFVVYLSSIATGVGFTALLETPDLVRGSSGYLETFPLYGKLLFYLGPLCLVLTVFPAFIRDRGGLSRWTRVALAAYLLGSQAALLQRTNLFICLVWIAGLLVMRTRSSRVHVGRRRVVALGAAAILAVASFQVLGAFLGKTGVNDPRLGSALHPVLRDSQVASLLWYASSGIPAFAKLVNSDVDEWPNEGSGDIWGAYNPQTYGGATFVGPLKLVPGVPHWREIAPFVNVPGPTNVYTWLEPWYRDFRGLGVLVGSLGTGLLCGGLAKRAKDGNPKMVLLAGLVIGYSGLATFINVYFAVLSVVLYFAVFVLGSQRGGLRP